MKNLLGGSRFPGKTLVFACAATICISPLVGNVHAAPGSAHGGKGKKGGGSNSNKGRVKQTLQIIEGAIGRALTDSEKQEITSAIETRDAAIQAVLQSGKSSSSSSSKPNGTVQKAIDEAHIAFIASVAKTLDMEVDELTAAIAKYVSSRDGDQKGGGKKGGECKDKSGPSTGGTSSGTTGSPSSY